MRKIFFLRGREIEVGRVYKNLLRDKHKKMKKMIEKFLIMRYKYKVVFRCQIFRQQIQQIAGEMRFCL